MYLAIDIGGTKTLLAVFNLDGKVVSEEKFETNKDYSHFIDELRQKVSETSKQHKITACCIAAPGEIDHTTNVVKAFGNLPWRNVDFVPVVEGALSHVPVYINNDAKLAAVYEASEFPHYRKVLYLTVSTGIGLGFIVDGRIDPLLEDSEPGQMIIEHQGQYVKWESVASGRALYEKYGKKASEIDDPKIWRDFVKALALGISELAAVITPQIIVIGGGVGAHFEKFSKYLDAELDKLASDMVPKPRIIKAKRAEEAVVYGCYQYIKQNITAAHKTAV